MSDVFICEPLSPDFYLKGLNAAYHREDSFREQMGVLYGFDYPFSMPEAPTHVTLLRSFSTVGLSGSASLDHDRPGEDTSEAWETMDYIMEQKHGAGLFHTHPPGILNWSTQDIQAQNGLAKANGRKLLWHGVQACSGDGVLVYASRFVCSWMENGRVFRYDYGTIEDHLENPIITLPMPPTVHWANGAYVIDSQDA